MKTRLLVLLIVAAFITALAGCGRSQVSQETTAAGTAVQTTASETKASSLPASYVSDQKIKVTYLIQEHPSWPFNKDWTFWKDIQEATNIEFDFITSTGDAMGQKLKMLSATNDLPDLINYNLATANELGLLGQLTKVNEYMDKMPNFQREVMNASPDAKDILTAGDGNIYFMPQVGLPKYTKVWLYRSDIFKKHNLTPPTNTDELYNVLKELKKLYPDSTPLTSRNAMTSAISDWFLDLTLQWDTGEMVYYNEKTGKWQFGPIEDNYKAMLQFLNKLMSEGLLDPEWSTLATKQWEDKLYANDKAFVTYDFVYRIETMLAVATQQNPDWKLEALVPVTQDGIGEKKYSIRSQIVQSDGYMISAKSKYVNELFKYADYMYSREGALLSNFGKVGETAVLNPDGSYDYSKDIKTPRNPSGTKEYQADFGFMSLGSFFVNTPDANEILYLSNKDVKAAFDLFDKNGYAQVLQPVKTFTEDERKQVAELESSIRDYTIAQVVSFVQKGGFDQWDAYVAKIKDLKVDQLLEIYNAMQARKK